MSVRNSSKTRAIAEKLASIMLDVVPCLGKDRSLSAWNLAKSTAVARKIRNWENAD